MQRTRNSSLSNAFRDDPARLLSFALVEKDSPVKELTNSLKAVLYSRVSSPIYSTFILAWCVYNWEAVLTLLFSEEALKVRIEACKALFYTDEGFHWGTFWWPIAVTLFFLVVKPVLTSIHYAYSEWLKAKAEKKREEFNSGRLLTLEQSQSYIDELNRYRDRYNNLLVERNEELKRTQDHTDLLSQELSDVRNQLDSNQDELTVLKVDFSEKNETIKDLNYKMNEETSKSNELERQLIMAKTSVSNVEEENAKLSAYHSDMVGGVLSMHNFLVALESNNIFELIRTDSQFKEGETPDEIFACYIYIMCHGFSSAQSAGFADEYARYVVENRIDDIGANDAAFILRVIGENPNYERLDDYPVYLDIFSKRANMHRTPVKS